MPARWMIDRPAGAPLPGPNGWQAEGGGWTRHYADAPQAPGPGWVQLLPLQAMDGASAGQVAPWHYVVEADVAPEHEADFNAWYAQEHLPGLAAVPGTVHAARWRRASGQPLYLACYDLTDPATLQRPEWLAVRHTAWSSRVRPTFVNPRRTMFSALR